MSANWAALVFGLVSITVGILLIVRRSSLARENAEQLRQRVGTLGAHVAKSSTPGSALAVGIGFMVIGSVNLVGFVISVLR